MRFGIDHPLYFRLLAIPDAFGPRDPESAETVAAGIRQLVDRVAELIKQGITSGELAPGPNGLEDVDVYAADAADFLHGAWNGLIALSQRDDSLRLDEKRLEAVEQVGVHIIRYGISPRQPEGP